ncbi:MAG: flavodoxin family protein, partial [Lachnospiraceae bacterium]|nr:flavodoxin family protein [Lachnospiraceae bacterium]
GEVIVIDAYTSGIAGCIDCRYCWKRNGCAIKDGMQEIYDYIQDCDNVVIASPIYFAELSGMLLALGSRLQTYVSAKYMRKETPIAKPKKGAVILEGGGSGEAERAYETAKELLKLMNCTEIHELVASRKTDHVPASEDDEAMAGVERIRDFFENI